MRPVFKLARWGGSQRGSCKFARSFVPEVYDGVVRQIMPFYDITQSETVDITRIICHHYYSREQRRTATDVCYRLLDTSGVFISVENIMSNSVKGIQLGIERWKRFQIEHGRTNVMVEKQVQRFNSECFPITVNEHLSCLNKLVFRPQNSSGGRICRLVSMPLNNQWQLCFYFHFSIFSEICKCFAQLLIAIRLNGKARLRDYLVSLRRALLYG